MARDLTSEMFAEEDDYYGKGWPGVFREAAAKEVTIVADLDKRASRSPDIQKLRLYNNHLVFVYDDFQSIGGSKLDGKLLGRATSTHGMYTLRGFRNPILFQNTAKDSPLKGRIKGEVYAMSTEMLIALDKNKANGIMFNRTKRSFILKEQSYNTTKGQLCPSVSCWVYLAVPEYWENSHLPTMPQFAYAGNKEKKYYEFFPHVWSSEVDRIIH